MSPSATPSLSRAGPEKRPAADRRRQAKSSPAPSQRCWGAPARGQPEAPERAARREWEDGASALRQAR
eukprot:9076811-Alexandrium_andersonii.AAC.1